MRHERKCFLSWTLAMPRWVACVSSWWPKVRGVKRRSDVANRLSRERGVGISRVKHESHELHQSAHGRYTEGAERLNEWCEAFEHEYSIPKTWRETTTICFVVRAIPCSKRRDRKTRPSGIARKVAHARTLTLIGGEERKSEIQSAMMAMSGDHCAMVSAHELKVCPLRRELLEAGRHNHRLREELGESSRARAKLAAIRDNLIETELSVRMSGDTRGRHRSTG